MEKILGYTALQIANLQLGVQEQPRGSNSGPEVDLYLKSVGLEPGYAWCMAFVYYCVGQAAAQLAVKNPLIKTGGVMLQANKTKLPKLTPRDAKVKPGDIFIMAFKNGTGHTGFVEKIKNGIITTVEGNTNNDGSREGFKVARRQRLLSTIQCFIQLN